MATENINFVKTTKRSLENQGRVDKNLKSHPPHEILLTQKLSKRDDIYILIDVNVFLYPEVADLCI